MTEEGRDVINISSSLLAILCLTRYEDWTFREAEMRLGEHQELRAALGLEQAPDDTTLFRVLWRVDTEVRTRALAATVARLPPSPSQVANGMVVAASRGPPRRGWPPPQRAATSWILPATGALSGHASSGRSWAEAGWLPWMCRGAPCGATYLRFCNASSGRRYGTAGRCDWSGLGRR